MPEENVEIEEKFKISFLNLERKILDLESLISDFSKKMEEIKKIKRNMEELEDLSMVNSLALVDLKKKIEEEGIKKDKFQNMINEVKTLKNALKTFKTDFEEFKKVLPAHEIKEKIPFIETIIKNLVKENEELKCNFSELTSILDKIKKEISKIEEESIQKIVSEITLIRKELYKDIRELREQVEKLSEKTSTLDIALLASKFNSLKENVDYLLNRKVEIDMKLKNLEENLSKILSGRKIIFEGTIKDMTRIPKRLELFEEKLKNLKITIEKIENRTKVIGNKINAIEIFSAIPTERGLEILERLENIEKKLRSLKEPEIKDLSSVVNLIKSEISKINQKIEKLKNKISSFEKSSKAIILS